MDAGSVARPAQQWPSWKLAPPIAQLTQGLVVNGFGGLETGRALFLRIGSPDEPGETGGAWLRTLEAIAPVTSAIPPQKSDPDAQSQATALAFTWTGLKRMGLPETALASFSRPFREGMLQEDRLRRLGDRRGGKWLETVVKGGPVWSANTPLRAPTDQRINAYDVPHGDTEQHVTTPVTVHAILLLYTRDEVTADRWAKEVEVALKPHGITIVHRLGLVLDVEQAGISREHFGFADGLSQPAPFDERGAVTLEGRPVLERHPVQGVPLGEFLIGYLNGHHEKAPGPVAPGDLQNTPDQRPKAAGLLPHEEAQGFYDLGLNGSYLVVRELRQDVAAFWQSMDENAALIKQRDPQHSDHVTAEWLAERVVGRDRQGHLLCPGGRLAPDELGLPDNNYLFHRDDPHGIGCPPGSHVRRANPRDALAPTEAQRADLLAAANNHRILRRGRKFGPRIADDRIDDGVDRGLLFMCLNTDIARQFEFIQQTWLLNTDFATLFEETDPLVGPEGRMTIREDPLRRTVHVKTFIQMVGGDYFFLPSLPALRYLAALGESLMTTSSWPARCTYALAELEDLRSVRARPGRNRIRVDLPWGTWTSFVVVPDSGKVTCHLPATIGRPPLRNAVPESTSPTGMMLTTGLAARRGHYKHYLSTVGEWQVWRLASPLQAHYFDWVEFGLISAPRIAQLRFATFRDQTLLVEVTDKEARVEPFTTRSSVEWDVIVGAARIGELDGEHLQRLLKDRSARHSKPAQTDELLFDLALAYAVLGARSWYSLAMAIEMLRIVEDELVDVSLLDRELQLNRREPKRGDAAENRALRLLNRSAVPVFRWGIRLGARLLSRDSHLDRIAANLLQVSAWTTWRETRLNPSNTGDTTAD